MVRIKHAARLISVRVPLESESMAPDEALEASVSRREASVEVTSSQSVEVSGDCESRSGGSKETESPNQ
jgi:hypothetical protein